MSDGYQADDDEILVHRYDGDHDDAWFHVGTGHGVGTPHFFVCLDENGGERSWWLDLDQAETLGRRLITLADECRVLNDEQASRLAAWRKEHLDEG